MTCITYHKGHIYSDRKVICKSINSSKKVTARPKYSIHNTGIVFATTGVMINDDIDTLIHALLLFSINKEIMLDNRCSSEDIQKVSRKIYAILEESRFLIPAFIGGIKEYIFYFDTTDRDDLDLLFRIDQFDTHSIGSDSMNVYMLIKQGMKPEDAYAKVAKWSNLITPEVDKTPLTPYKKVKTKGNTGLLYIPA